MSFNLLKTQLWNSCYVYLVEFVKALSIHVRISRRFALWSGLETQTAQFSCLGNKMTLPVQLATGILVDLF